MVAGSRSWPARDNFSIIGHTERQVPHGRRSWRRRNRAARIARINPLRFKRGAKGEFDDVIGKIRKAAKRFDAAKIEPGDVTGASGPPEE